VRVINAENISKLYRLGQVGTGSIFDDLNRWWHIMRGKDDPYIRVGEINDRTRKGSSDYVWALKDINFEVQQGEVLGIIGRNGAGKSTLLKILSRTTAPTTGTIKVKGRIASLLEVGTGFHPELCGRDNIFMNGTILGMTRSEIKSRFDEIVEFAGIERYLDTPVKRYSSGMYLRLAFAVAAHLESEILIVDEVLAVGDYEFQKKCLGKMKDVSESQGRTVLFVSHNMQSVASLSSRLLIMNNGLVRQFSNPSEGIDFYNHENTGFDINRFSGTAVKGLADNDYLVLNEYYLCDETGNRKSGFSNNETIVVNLGFDVKNTDPLLTVGIGLYTADGVNLFWSIHLEEDNPVCLQEGHHNIKIFVQGIQLNEGNYKIELIVALHNKQWIYRPEFNAPYLIFSIFSKPGLRNIWSSKRQGSLVPCVKYIK
jgi:lipopolysaccharide transport system ATP-binding protein